MLVLDITKTTTQNGYWTKYWGYPGWGTASGTEYSGVAFTSSVEQKDSVRTPNWRDVKNKPLLLPENPYYRKSYKHSLASGSFTTYEVDGQWVTRTTHTGNMDIWTGHSNSTGSTLNRATCDSVADTKAISSLHQELRQGKFLSAVSIAEGPKTFKMFAQTASTLARAFVQLKRGRLNGCLHELGKLHPSDKVAAEIGLNNRELASRNRRISGAMKSILLSMHGHDLQIVGQKRLTAKTRRDMLKEASREELARFDRVRKVKGKDYAAAQAWLELQYGWKPVLFDISNAMGALADVLREQPPNARAVGLGRYKDESTKSVNTVLDGCTSSSVCFERYETGVKYVAIYTKTDVANQTTFGLTSVASTIYELIPLSFVWDWALPIGNYLESLDATRGFELKSLSKTTLKRYVYSRSCTAVSNRVQTGNATQYKYVVPKFNAYVTDLVMQRTLATKWPQMPFPAFQNPLSLSHAISAVSLLRVFT